MNPEYFKLNNGEIIKHYSELPYLFERISDYEFHAHVNEAKNDFAKWVHDVYGLDDLSTYLSMAKNRHEAKRVMKAYLKMAEVKFQFKAPLTNQNLAKPKAEEQKITKISKTNETDADKFFKENPIIISNRVEAKKDALLIEHLNNPIFTGYETPEQLISNFKDIYAKAYERVVFLRKNGFDTKLIEVMLFRIPPKMKIFEASKENKDAEIIKRYLNEAIDELNKAK